MEHSHTQDPGGRKATMQNLVHSTPSLHGWKLQKFFKGPLFWDPATNLQCMNSSQTKQGLAELYTSEVDGTLPLVVIINEKEGNRPQKNTELNLASNQEKLNGGKERDRPTIIYLERDGLLNKF